MNNSSQAVVSRNFADEDAVFDVLASARRRTVVRCLRSAESPLAVADLARDVVATERDVGPRDVSEEDVERAYTSLHHVHLPKLADGGYIGYDDDRSAVSLTADAGRLTPLLDWAASRTE